MMKEVLARFEEHAPLSGIASHDAFSRVFALLDAQRFDACFIAWMQQLCVPSAGGRLDRSGWQGGARLARWWHDITHLVSAWHHRAGVASASRSMRPSSSTACMLTGR